MLLYQFPLYIFFTATVVCYVSS